MALTKQEAINWIKSSVGKGFDTDGMYGFQCKDLVNAFANYLGYPFKAGNAISINQPQKGWTRQGTPQAGDVFVMDFWSGGVNYGHTGIVETVNKDGTFTSVDQNWLNFSLNKGSKAARVKHPMSGVKFYRPTYKATPAKPKPQPKQEWKTVKNPVAYVRKQPNSKAGLSGSRILPKSTKFRVVGSVRGEKVAGIDKWYKTVHGNYVWSGALK